MATTYMTNARLDANSARAGQDYQDVDTLRIIGQKPTMSAAESEIQRILETRAAQERAAQLERPTYGMWGMKEGENEQHLISSDPNKIAEINARAEMRRTGLDRYYHPQSGAYFDAFHKIRDKYLQQELGKKAAVEAEGRAIVANRVGAFDKILQAQLQAKTEAEKNKGLIALREAQAREANARAKSYEGDGMTPAQRRQATEHMRTNLISEANRRLADYEKIEKEYGILPPEKRPANYNDIQKAKQVTYSTIEYLMGGGDPTQVQFLDTGVVGRATNAQGRYNTSLKTPAIQAPVAQGVKINNEKEPATENNVKYKTKADALSAIKELPATQAFEVMKQHGITNQEVRDFLQKQSADNTPSYMSKIRVPFSG